MQGRIGLIQGRTRVQSLRKTHGAIVDEFNLAFDFHRDIEGKLRKASHNCEVS